MNNQEIQNELLQVQKEIAELPAGYISRKNINGKTRYYLQWTEDGKKKSKYVDDAIVDDLRVKIERRRELQKRERELTFMLPKPMKTERREEGKHVFKTDVMLGENLKSYVQTVAKYKKRNLYKNICDYVYGDVRDRVFILYGLRRTGKTTLIRQVISEMNDEDFSRTVFIQVGAGIGLSDINQDLKYLMNSGYKYVFIDEVTLIEDFIEGAALFSDIFAACGMKIVLSGTDSLGFFFSEDEQLKHSKEQAKEQFRHLIDEEKLKNTEFRYGKITKRTVIYRGENATLENGIEYRNVEDYLKSLL